MRLRYALVALAAATSLIAAACGDDKGGDTATTKAPSATTAASAAEPDIVISGFAFQVKPAKTGTITVRNDDSTPHTVTADDGAFSIEVGAGKTATFEVGTAGSFAFHCNFHSSMKATLVVS